MLSPARSLCSRFRAHVADEKGISTIEWIGLTAVVLVLLSAIFAYVQLHGGQVGTAAGSSMDGQIALWEHDGSGVATYSDESPSDGPYGLPAGLRDRLGKILGRGLSRIREDVLRRLYVGVYWPEILSYQVRPDEKQVEMALEELRRQGGGKARLAEALEAAWRDNKVGIAFNRWDLLSATSASGDRIELSRIYTRSDAEEALAHEGFHSLVGLELGSRLPSLEEEVYAYYLGCQAGDESAGSSELERELQSIDFSDPQRAMDIIGATEPYKTALDKGEYTRLFSEDKGERDQLRLIFERYRSQEVGDTSSTETDLPWTSRWSSGAGDTLAVLVRA